MALEKITVTDKIEILEDGQIQIRQSTRIVEDNIVIAETYHRHVIVPGEDATKEDSRVANIASLLWTKEVVDAYRAKMAEIENMIPKLN